MNILLGRDSHLVFVLFFSLTMLGTSLQGAACAEPDRQRVVASSVIPFKISAFYTIKLSEYPHKFIEAACLAIIRDKGLSYLEQGYDVDVRAQKEHLLQVKQPVKKSKKSSLLNNLSLEEELRKLCVYFNQIYYEKIIGWKRYKPEIVQSVIEDIFKDPCVDAFDILKYYQSDSRELRTQSREQIFKQYCCPKASVSFLLQSIVVNCEHLRLASLMADSAASKTMVRLPVDQYARLPNMKDVVVALEIARLQGSAKSLFDEDLCSMAIAIVAQSISKKPERINGRVEKQMIVDEYVDLVSVVVGEPWFVDTRYKEVASQVLTSMIVTPRCKDYIAGNGDRVHYRNLCNLTLRFLLFGQYTSRTESLLQENAHAVEKDYLKSVNQLLVESIVQLNSPKFDAVTRLRCLKVLERFAQLKKSSRKAVALEQKSLQQYQRDVFERWQTNAAAKVQARVSEEIEDQKVEQFRQKRDIETAQKVFAAWAHRKMKRDAQAYQALKNFVPKSQYHKPGNNAWLPDPVVEKDRHHVYGTYDERCFLPYKPFYYEQYWLSPGNVPQTYSHNPYQPDVLGKHKIDYRDSQ